jgi:hypothetical protein
MLSYRGGSKKGLLRDKSPFVKGSSPICGANSDLILQKKPNLAFKSIANLSPKNGNHITNEALQEFAMFCKVDLLRSRKTIKDHINNLSARYQAQTSPHTH